MNILEILGIVRPTKEVFIRGDAPQTAVENKYRIIKTEDGRYFPQVYGYMWGTQSWLFINEFSAKDGHPAWYPTYKYEVHPIELEQWCTDLPTAKRILEAAKNYYSERKNNVTNHKTYCDSKIAEIIQ